MAGILPINKVTVPRVSTGKGLIPTKEPCLVKSIRISGESADFFTRFVPDPLSSIMDILLDFACGTWISIAVGSSSSSSTEVPLPTPESELDMESTCRTGLGGSLEVGPCPPETGPAPVISS